MDISNEFSEENGIADLTLVVDDHKIQVCKSVLCIASPVFRAMLKGDFKEKTKTEIPLPGKKYEDFVEFLRCIYPDKMGEITERNVYMLLPLAQEYGVGNIVKRCQKFLLLEVKREHTQSVEQLYRHISLSEKYNMEELKEKCIYLASEHTVNQLKDAKSKYNVTDNIQCKVLELALRRHEFHRADERNIVVRTGSEESFFGGFTLKFRGDVKMDDGNEADCLQVLRLTERLQTVNAEPNFKADLLKKVTRSL